MNQLSCPKDGLYVLLCVCVPFSICAAAAAADCFYEKWGVAGRKAWHTLDTTCLQQGARLQFGVTFNQQLVCRCCPKLANS